MKLIFLQCAHTLSTCTCMCMTDPHPHYTHYETILIIIVTMITYTGVLLNILSVCKERIVIILHVHFNFMLPCVSGERMLVHDPSWVKFSISL